MSQAAGAAAAAGFVVLACFQVALAAGAPLGRAAWGGAHDRLPRRLRVGSAVAAGVWVVAAVVILEGAGHDVSPMGIHGGALGAWGLFVLLALGALMNLASKSRWERFLMSPFAALLSVLCLIIALGAR